jgi:rod shape-determining protein MreD
VITLRETLAREPSRRLLVYSFLVALLFNLWPWPHQFPAPDLVAVLLVFWSVQTPRRMGMTLAWLLGLVMDAHQGVLLGEHALIYCLLTYGAISLHRRMAGFGPSGQALHVAGLFLVVLIVGGVVNWFADSTPLTLWILVETIVNALGWLVAHRLLLTILKRRPASRPARPAKIVS